MGAGLIIYMSSDSIGDICIFAPIIFLQRRVHCAVQPPIADTCEIHGVRTPPRLLGIAT